MLLALWHSSQRWYEDGGFSYHEGEGRQAAMVRAAADRALVFEGVSRPFTREDIMNYDYVVAMDEGNHNELHVACRAWGEKYAGQCATTPSPHLSVLLTADVVDSNRCPFVFDAPAAALKKVKLLGSYASYRNHLDPLNRPGGERLSLPEADQYIGKEVRPDGR